MKHLHPFRHLRPRVSPPSQVITRDAENAEDAKLREREQAEWRANALLAASARTDLLKLVKALRRADRWIPEEIRQSLAAILTSSENGEEKQKDLGES